MEKQYDDNVKLWKKAYTELLNASEEYTGFSGMYGFGDINRMRESARNHLQLIEWYEKYGLKLSHDITLYNGYVCLSEYTTLEVFRNAELCKEEGRGRSISWPDDDRQPEDGWYYNISFSTGAYIFGDDYDGQKELFKQFINELKAYNPDHSDTVNHSFYWKIENCKNIFDDFSMILKKYNDINKSELQARKVEALKAELEKEKAKLTS